MKSYTLTQTRNQHGEVFDKASVEPILITKQKRPSHVILAADTYQNLIARLEELEDLHHAQAAEAALKRSSMVGSKEFTSALEAIANAQA
ncbi:MAG: type II toxin-antitoxin system Phd/YefM family antitoxin [Cyanobacteria bacterium J06623_7]